MGQRLTLFSKLLVASVLTVPLVTLPSTAFGAEEAGGNNAFSAEEEEQSDEGISDQTVHFEPQVSTESAAVAGEEEGLVFPQADPYKAEFVSQNAYPRLLGGQANQFTVTVKNVGATVWDPVVVHLATDRPRDRIPGFLREDIVGHRPSGWINGNRVQILIDEITGKPMGDMNGNGFTDPGETATFAFWYSVPQTMADGTHREYFNLVADSLAWFNDLGIFWEITVDNRPHARWIDQNAYPPTLLAGHPYEFWVRFENTGLQPWRDAGPTPVHLGTDRPMDRVPGFKREGPAGTNAGWVRENRVKLERDSIGNLVGDVNLNGQIDPGEIARFRFSYTVPETMETGTYQEYFRPVMDNRDYGWMEDYGVFWANVVNHIAPRPASVTVKPQVNHLNISWSASVEAESYKVRYGPVGGGVFTVSDFPSSMTAANIDVAGGQDYDVGVASVDTEGISPFTTSVVHIESPEEAQARVAAAEARQERLAEEQRKVEEERRAQEEPVVTGPAGEQKEDTRDWRQFWLTLLIILGAAGLATAGYYGYEWWTESRRRARPTKTEPPKREKLPKPPTGTSTRW